MTIEAGNLRIRNRKARNLRIGKVGARDFG